MRHDVHRALLESDVECSRANRESADRPDVEQVRRWMRALRHTSRIDDASYFCVAEAALDCCESRHMFCKRSVDQYDVPAESRCCRGGYSTGDTNYGRSNSSTDSLEMLCYPDEYCTRSNRDV
jgi:hypothetical protein